MAHGGYGKRRVKPAGRRSKGLGIAKKPKSVSLKNQIRSVERLLRKDQACWAPIEGLGHSEEAQVCLPQEPDSIRRAVAQEVHVPCSERRKIERRIRRWRNRASSGQAQDAEVADQLTKLKEDLEYVRFFPKTEKYLSLFTGDENSDIVDRRNKLRKQIKANLVAAAASGKDLEETGSEDDGLMDLSEDDFFLAGSSSDEADADDEWTDKSTREQASSASGKAASGMSSDERNQRQISARALMPPPGPATTTASSSGRSQSRFGPSSSKIKSIQRTEMSASSNTSNSRSGSDFKFRGSSNSGAGHSSNLSSNSDAHKPRRKRRPKKRKQQGVLQLHQLHPSYGMGAVDEFT
ncbi:hypothetical protein CJ030_MR3G014512 [Morella rubra]|uniref:rRNA-processing protein EFG1 n=1 Tax=Morella rubra TaxID=262757 RepID=A0A6A1W2T3_9ROSI|nr:hypothetical protein CJ030_MR3G014512 [Morella rubra]